MYVDYVVDETLSRSENNHLIDVDTGEPNVHLTKPSEVALAKIASVFHQNAQSLTPEQFEQIASWAKRWKLGMKDEPRKTRWDFSSVLDSVRDSKLQKKLQKDALKKLLVAGLFSAIFVFLAIASAAVAWGGEGIGWGWKLVLGGVLFVTYVVAEAKMREGLMIGKEQDRRYALSSIREARSVSELNEAGLFAYMPRTSYQEQGFDESEAMALIRAEVERLSDALYNDPDSWLLHTEYPWWNQRKNDSD